MFTIKTLNKIFPEGLTALDKEHYTVSSDADSPDGIIVRSADMLSSEFDQKLRAIARAGRAQTISRERCACEGIVVFNTPEQMPTPSRSCCAPCSPHPVTLWAAFAGREPAGNEQAEALLRKRKQIRDLNSRENARSYRTRGYRRAPTLRSVWA